MSQTVKTSSRLWSQEVALANAANEMDYARPGQGGIAEIQSRKEPGYEWSNGRKFNDGKGPYE